MSSTIAYYFPDTSVLINFALIRRLDLLVSYLGGNGRMTQAVRAEVTKSAAFVPALAQFDVEAHCGAAIVLNEPSDVQGVLLMRKRFAVQGDAPTKHLGESETLFLLKARPQFAMSRILTEDGDAYRAAGALGLLRHHTVEVFQSLVARGDVTAAQAFDLIEELTSNAADRTLIARPLRPQDLVR